MEHHKYPIPTEILAAAIDAMRALNMRLEVEAAALARLKSAEAEQLARVRLEDAEAAGKLFEFYLNL